MTSNYWSLVEIWAEQTIRSAFFYVLQTLAQSILDAEYTDCISAEGYPPQRVSSILH